MSEAGKENVKQLPQKIAPMSEKDWADVIRIIRNSPLQNMDAAEAVSGLLMRLGNHANETLGKKSD